MLTTFGNFGVTVGQIEDNISKYMKFLGKGVGGRGERYSCTLCGNQGTKTEITLHLHENHVGRFLSNHKTTRLQSLIFVLF